MSTNKRVMDGYGYDCNHNHSLKRDKAPWFVVVAWVLLVVLGCVTILLGAVAIYDLKLSDPVDPSAAAVEAVTTH
jgi:hypothetical protein